MSGETETVTSKRDMNSESAATLAETSQHLAEDLAGAEFVAAVEMAETVGISVEFADRVSEIVKDQTRYLKADYGATWRDIKAGELPPLTMSRHLQRRISHSAEGLGQYYQALYAEQAKLLNLGLTIWQPLLKMVRDDLQRR